MFDFTSTNFNNTYTGSSKYNFGLQSNFLPPRLLEPAVNLGTDSYTHSIDERRKLFTELSIDLLRPFEHSQPRTFREEELGLPSPYSLTGVPADPNDLVFSIMAGIANGNFSSQKVIRDIFTDPLAKSFEDASPEFVTDYSGQSYAGIPVGGYLNDINNSRDAEFQASTLQGRLQFLNYMVETFGRGLSGVTTMVKERAMKTLLTQGIDEGQANIIAMNIVDNFTRKASSFLGELESAAKQLRSGIERLKQVATVKKNQDRANNSLLKQSIDGFNGN
jgi:hypothetical protein